MLDKHIPGEDSCAPGREARATILEHQSRLSGIQMEPCRILLFSQSLLTFFPWPVQLAADLTGGSIGDS